MPPIIGNLGLILFIYIIGIQGGWFFESFRKQGRNLAILATIIVGSASILTFAAFWWSGIDMPVALGLLTGALTSTFFPIATGIVLGILLGKLSISFGGGMAFNLCLTSGVLAVAMVLSRFGRTGL